MLGLSTDLKLLDFKLGLWILPACMFSFGVN